MRNFGIQSGHASLSGASSTDVPASRDNYASRDSNVVQLHPLPAQSLRPDPLITDDDRSNIAGRFAVAVISICFLVPMILAGIMMRFH